MDARSLPHFRRTSVRYTYMGQLLLLLLRRRCCQVKVHCGQNRTVRNGYLREFAYFSNFLLEINAEEKDNLLLQKLFYSFVVSLFTRSLIIVLVTFLQGNLKFKLLNSFKVASLANYILNRTRSHHIDILINHFKFSIFDMVSSNHNIHFNIFNLYVASRIHRSSTLTSEIVTKTAFVCRRI